MLRRARFLLTLLLLAPLIASAPRAARATLGEQLDSVHFNSGQPDFGLPPVRGRLYDDDEFAGERGEADGVSFRYGLNEVSFSGQDIPAAEYQSDAERSARAHAADAESRFDWKAARKLYQKLAVGTRWTGDLRDRVETLTEALDPANRGVAPGTIRGYLGAVDRTNKSYATAWSATRRAFADLAANKSAGFLRAHALYQIASIDAGLYEYHKAIGEYQALLRDYPQTVKREAALIMIARCAILPGTAAGRDLPTGEKALHDLRAANPASRFEDAARGLQARIDYLQGHYDAPFRAFCELGDAESARIVLTAKNPPHSDLYYPSLLCAYLRQMNRAETYSRYTSSVRGIARMIAEMSPAGAREFVAAMRRDPAGLAAPYLYYRLYHCENAPRDLKGLLHLARTFTPNAQTLPPAVRLRLAEVFYRSGALKDALVWAQTAKGVDAAGTPNARALYVEGATLNRLHRLAPARADFEALLARCPYSELRSAARENLALIAEAQGDMATSLDQYFALNYRDDIAYFLDARMTTPQVAAYVASRPHHPQRSLLVYSLGIRHLREEDWAGAGRALMSLPHREYVKLWKPDDDGGRGFDALPQPSPLQTIADLSRLQRVAQNAPTPAAQASAWFRYASYYYDKGTLVLYNNALWHGDRMFQFDIWWNTRHATTEDDAATRRHMYQHEAYAHTEAICERIAHDYPNTPTAPYALYRAGCCADKLSNFNVWWRGDNDHRNQEQEASKLMARIRRDYPRCPLVKEAKKFAEVFRIDADAADQERREERKEREENAKS